MNKEIEDRQRWKNAAKFRRKKTVNQSMGADKTRNLRLHLVQKGRMSVVSPHMG